MARRKMRWLFRLRCLHSRRQRNFWDLFTVWIPGRHPRRWRWLRSCVQREASSSSIKVKNIPDLEELFEKEYLYTLSDLLYFVRQEQAGITVKMNKKIQSSGSVGFPSCRKKVRRISGERGGRTGSVFYRKSFCTVPMRLSYWM